MSFGKQDDEFFTIELKTLLENKEILKQHPEIMNYIPVLTNYELQAGFVFQLSIPPFAFDVSLGESYESLQPNNYQLQDHLNISMSDLEEYSGCPKLAFNSTQHKGVNDIIKGASNRFDFNI